MYKYNKKLLPQTFNNYFLTAENTHDYKTRNKSSYRIPKHSTEMFKKTLKTTGSTLWNKLESRLKNIVSFNTYKKSLKQHLIEK